MAAQTANVIKIKSNKHEHIIIFQDSLCEECGGIIRYDTHLERACEKCGLVSEVTIFDQSNSEFTGRQLQSWEKSRYDLTIEVNRDKIIDMQRSEDGPTVQDGIYEPEISGGTYDPTYAYWYNFRRK